jgi:serine/threonine protein kinase/tetratricopeptide (TPR) repeat protein
MNINRDLVFAALAFRAEMMDSGLFVSAVQDWADSPAKPLGRFLVDRGILADADREALERQAELKIKQHDGDAQATLGELAGQNASIQSFLGSFVQPTIEMTLDADSNGNGSRATPMADALAPGNVRRESEAVHAPDVQATMQDTNHGLSKSLNASAETVDSHPGSLGLSHDAGTMPTLDSAPPVSDGSPGHVRVSTLGPVPGEASKISRYTRSKLHAQGGIGKVWLAKDLSLNRDVALKELRPDRLRNPRVWARFVEEARITGQLEHPGIVPIYELTVDSETGQLYYTMKFIRGKTLAEASKEYHDACKAGKDDPVQFRQLLNAFTAVCQAVAYAHSRGVVHRDLKGQNVVLGDYGEVIVLDWGLAKVLDEQEDLAAELEPAKQEDVPSEPELSGVEPGAGRFKTMQGQVLGTPAYMPPEQAAGKLELVNQRSDVYSLGAILYELLCGNAPFLGSDTLDLLRRVREVPPEPPHAIRTGVPRGLEAIALRAMAKNPDNRYATAQELAADVARWLADEPVSVYRDPITVQIGRWARKHRTLLTAAAAIALVSIVGLGIGNILIGRERDQVRAQREVARQAVDEMYHDVASQWLEDRSDALQEKFYDRALAAYAWGAAESELPEETQAATDSPAPDDLDPTAKSLLARSMAYYRDLAEQRSQALDDRIKRIVARIRLGRLEHRMGRLEDAKSDLDLAGKDVDRAQGEVGSTPELNRLKAQIFSALGSVELTQGKLEAAASSFLEAVKAFEGNLTKGAAGDAAGRTQDRLELSRTLREAGDAAKLSGNYELADAQYRHAISVLESESGAPTTEIAYQRELALTLDARGVLLMAWNQPREALPLLRSAEATLAPLVAQQPLRPALRDALAKTANSIGLLENRELDREAARAALERSSREYERLCADFPDRPEYKRGLARAGSNLSIVLRDQGEYAEAERVTQRTVDQLNALLKQAPGVVKVRRDLAIAQQNLGMYRLEQRKLESSAIALDEALKVQDGLIKDDPENADFRAMRAEILIKMGMLENELGKPAESVVKLEQAREALERLHGEFPDRMRYQEHLADCLSKLGTSLSAVEKPADAEASYRRAVSLYEPLLQHHPDQASYQRSMAEALNNLAELKPRDRVELSRRALELYEKLASRPNATLQDRTTRAIGLGNLAEHLVAAGQVAEARPLFTSAIAAYEAAAGGDSSAEATRMMYLAYVQGQRGDLELAEGQRSAAAEAFRAVIEARKKRIQLDPATALGEKRELVQAYQNLGRVFEQEKDHVALSNLASELVKTVSDLPIARVAAAELLVTAIDLVENQPQIVDSEKSLLARTYGLRAIAQIRASVEGGLTKLDRLTKNPRLQKFMQREELRDIASPAESAAKPAT